MRLRIISLLVILVLGLFMASALVSSDTLVGGKIYTSDFYNPTLGADVKVICIHNNIETSRTDTSLGDGTYAVDFPESECTEGDDVKVSASKGDYSGSSEGVIINCTGDACDSDHVAIQNIVMSYNPASDDDSGDDDSGDDGSGYYILPRCLEVWECGDWSECIDRTQTRTCNELNNCTTTLMKPDEQENCEVSNLLGNVDQELSPGILGAVVGLGGRIGNIGFIIALIIAIIILSLIVAYMRKK
ncbi:MAG: hypothetical protein ABIH72_00500 [archaeon]